MFYKQSFNDEPTLQTRKQMNQAPFKATTVLNKFGLLRGERDIFIFSKPIQKIDKGKMFLLLFSNEYVNLFEIILCCYV